MLCGPRWVVAHLPGGHVTSQAPGQHEGGRQQCGRASSRPRGQFHGSMGANSFSYQKRWCFFYIEKDFKLFLLKAGKFYLFTGIPLVRMELFIVLESQVY